MPNQLINSSSLYLKQHANNPVNWYPWSQSALKKAQDENKPILLSIGYAACHWCHVMERESFENEQIAQFLNQHFVSIKVDREERPDLDELYMKVVQALNKGNGGWPMTVILSPTGDPFFGGTYFPPTPRKGMPSFPQVLEYAQDLYHNQVQKRDGLCSQLKDYLKQAAALPPPAESISMDWFQRITESCTKDFDHQHGGFGHAPKFPPHGSLSSLLAYGQLTKDNGIEALAFDTLKGMARGGVYDHIGGGFARYSVDEQWRVPHFEKMLYDNAQLIPQYIEAFRATEDHHFKEIAIASLEYTLSNLALPNGGFASSQDADSEGVEGRYYCWSLDEIIEALGQEDGLFFAESFEVSKAGSYENGWSTLRLQNPLNEMEDTQQSRLRKGLKILKGIRDKRQPPARDDKLITMWNALLVSAFAKAGQHFNTPKYTQIAVDTLSTMRSLLFQRSNGRQRLLRRPTNNDTAILAFADDYAAYILACLDVCEANFSLELLQEARNCANDLIELFWDETEDGSDSGLFYTGQDAETLVVRSKKAVGGAEPSANALGALAFIRLGILFDDDDLKRRAEQIFLSYQTYAERAPQAIGWEAYACGWMQYPVQEVVIITDKGSASPFVKTLTAHPYPFRVSLTVSQAQLDEAAEQIPLLRRRTKLNHQDTAYLCENFTCLQPTTKAGDLADQLNKAQQSTHLKLIDDIRQEAPQLPKQASNWINGVAKPYDNHITIIDFWTHCSTNCVHVIPELQAVSKYFEGTPIQVIGIHSPKFTQEKDPSAIAHAVRRLGITHPVLMDGEHNWWNSFQVKAWPTLLVVDSRGKIAYRRSGEAKASELIAVCDRLLDEVNLEIKTSPPPTVHKSPKTSGLKYPSKICIFPNLSEQLKGGDPFALGSRLYVSDTGNNQIRSYHLTLDKNGFPKAIPKALIGQGTSGFTDGPAESAQFSSPQGLGCNKTTLFVADTGNHAIRAIDRSSFEVTTVSGTGHLGRGTMNEGGDPLKQDLRSPVDLDIITQSSSELVVIAMAGTHQLWLYIPESNRLGPFLGSGIEGHIDGDNGDAALAQPSGVVSVGQYLFFVDSETSSVRIYDFEKKNVGTLVGEGLFDFGDIDGNSDFVRLQHPMGLTAGAQELYIADTYNHKIKAISLNGAFTKTIYGNDSGQLNEPQGITRAGRFLLVADTNNHRIVCIDTQSGMGRTLID